MRRFGIKGCGPFPDMRYASIKDGGTNGIHTSGFLLISSVVNNVRRTVGPAVLSGL